MFYIDTRSLLKSRDRILFHILPTLAVVIVFAILVFFSWMTARQNVTTEQAQLLERKNQETSTLIRQRMETYEQILRGARGLFNASSQVSRAEWKQYLSAYNITERYPGIQGVGYAIALAPDEVKPHEQAVRAEGFPEYAVNPIGVREHYTSIVYIEPFSGRNLGVFGYDMYTQPSRRAAMDEARDSGEPAMSSLVRLVQEPDKGPGQPGFLIYLPIYKTKTIPTSQSERKAALQGYAYLPFRSYDLIDNTIPNTDQNYGFRVYNLGGTNRELMYESSSFKRVNNTPNAATQSTRIEVSGNTWEIEGRLAQAALSENVTNRPNSVLIGGTLFCITIGAFMYLLLGSRTRAISQKETQSIQEAKDELLALASHQLRTPATGVKQYVGMLREGFAGPLTPTQKKLLDKAYESNERQLGTINEMLFVARSDAGHLRMEKEPFDVVALTRDIADEQQGVIAQRQQTLQLKLPRRAIRVRGDKQYIRMAIENILSNATKYTRHEGVISLSITTRGNRVLIITEDTGVGVAKRHQQLLFKKFSRIPNELTNQVVGSGIGLYLAKQVIDAHKGSVIFESEEKKGARVTICLPRYTKPQPRTSRPSKRS